MSDLHREGTVLEGLSFEADGAAPDESQVTVLSCGGIFIPQRGIPSRLTSWIQVVNLPSSEFSAKIFGNSMDSIDPLKALLKNDSLH